MPAIENWRVCRPITCTCPQLSQGSEGTDHEFDFIIYRREASADIVH